ncbi:hypothetical protein LCGC14_2871250, partial [marine sediment metagenome]
MAVTVAQLRVRVETDLDDPTLQRILDANVKAIARAAGSATAESEDFLAQNSDWVAVVRPATAVVSIIERRSHSSDPVTLSANDYRQVGKTRFLRLGDGDNPARCWGAEVQLNYTPEVDTNIRDRVTIDLCHVDIEYRPFQEEKVGKGEWEGKADWGKQRRELLRQVREGRSLIV